MSGSVDCLPPGGWYIHPTRVCLFGTNWGCERPCCCCCYPYPSPALHLTLSLLRNPFLLLILHSLHLPPPPLIDWSHLARCVTVLKIGRSVENRHGEAHPHSKGDGRVAARWGAGRWPRSEGYRVLQAASETVVQRAFSAPTWGLPDVCGDRAFFFPVSLLSHAWLGLYPIFGATIGFVYRLWLALLFVAWRWRWACVRKCRSDRLGVYVGV